MKKTEKKQVFLNTIFILVGLLIVTGCKKFVDVPAPTTTLTEASVFSSDAAAKSVITGLYTNIANFGSNSGQLLSLSIYPGLTADELTPYNPGPYDDYYLNRLLSSQDGGYWTNFYSSIYVINQAIEGLSKSTLITPAVKNQLLGEAYFMRGYYYFYLINLYGDVPLILSTDYKHNSVASRDPQADVWKQVISDFTSAQSLLSSNFLDNSLINTTSERVRPTKWAATAMLAKAYLYTKDWTNAEKYASIVIDHSNGLFKLNNLEGVFLKNNSEAIWQIAPVGFGINAADGGQFIVPQGFTPATVYLSPGLYNSFENGDQRKIKWTDSIVSGIYVYHYPAKYKVFGDGAVNNSFPSPREYNMILRLGEQYLIRAEARAELSNTSGSLSDLNIIRNRAGLANYSGSTDQASLLNAIMHERRVELFTEFGNRWFDLKRTGTIDQVMNAACPLKGTTWNSNWQWYPIPATDLKYDPNLTQNAGY